MKKWLILSLAVGSLAACSSDEPGPKKTVDTSLSTEGSFCGSWAKAACNDKVLMNCQLTDKDTCVADQQSYCEDLVPTGYKSANAAECITAVRNAYQDGVLDAAELDVVLNLGGDCSHLVSGGRLAGEACTETTECDTVHNYTCVIKAGVTGTCQIPNLVGAGEACDGDAVLCDDGFYCKGNDTDGYNCVVQRMEGQTCASTVECDPTTLCVGATDTAKGVCTAKAKKGQPCMVNSDCDTGICLTTLTTPACIDYVQLALGSPLCVNLGGPI